MTLFHHSNGGFEPDHVQCNITGQYLANVFVQLEPFKLCIQVASSHLSMDALIVPTQLDFSSKSFIESVPTVAELLPNRSRCFMGDLNFTIRSGNSRAGVQPADSYVCLGLSQW